MLLKGCSEGGWRSGMRRSGDVGGGVQSTNLVFLYVPVTLLAPCVPRIGIRSGEFQILGSIARGFAARLDLALSPVVRIRFECRV